MKKRMKALGKALWLVAALLGLWAGNLCFPRPAYGDEPKVPVRITLDCPDEYYEDVLLLLGQYRLPLGFNYQQPNMGYEWSAVIPKGSYPLTVVSRTDFGDRYTYDYPKTIEVDGAMEVRIGVEDTYELTVQQREEFVSIGDRGGYEPGEGEWDTISVYQFAKNGYNLTPGYQTEAIIIASVPEGIDEVTYYLVSSDKIFDIKLTREDDFAAIVYMPSNIYYESARYVDELYGEPKQEGETYYMWTHGGFEDRKFGKTYALNDGRVLLINDLVLKEVSKEQALKVNDTLDYEELRDREYGLRWARELQALKEHEQRQTGGGA